MSEFQLTAASQAVKIKKDQPSAPIVFMDTVAKEHVFELKINQSLTRVITCSNYQLEEMVIGYLYTEGYIQSMEDVLSIEFAADKGSAAVSIYDAGGNIDKIKEKRSQILTTGTSRLEKTPINIPKLESRKSLHLPIDPELIMKHSEELLRENPWFDATGALHSASLALDNQKLEYLSVDLGRHNAVDKAIGAALKDHVDLTHCVLFTTGRVPTDMIWKAIRSNITVMVSRGAVTMDAIELAYRYGITLCGFSRGERLNIYTPFDLSE